MTAIPLNIAAQPLIISLDFGWSYFQECFINAVINRVEQLINLNDHSSVQERLMIERFSSYGAFDVFVLPVKDRSADG